jgi:serine/threonine-protein kinase
VLELVGRYRIQEQIGEGAMADVYRAYDPHIDRPLAIKVLKEEYRQDREYAVRFLREARAAGALSHPGIVTIFDVGEVDGYPFIVMELLEGEPLSEVLKQGSMRPAEVMTIGAQLCSALGYAHAQGVIHRDIKPSNIVLSPDRRTLKLLDFGIARVTEGDMLFEAESLKTQIGQVVGTPRYMSPEQALGRDLDGRSDIFSVGVVLYELAAGRRAFPGASAASLAAQITQADPESLAAIAPETPRGLQVIIQKAMSRDPAKRFVDAFRMSEALRRELAVNQTVSAEASARHRYVPLQVRQTLILTLITAVVLVLAVGTVLLNQRRAMREVALSAGTAVSAFVANNAALRAVDNAGLPAAQQDWLPVEVFVRSASADPNIRHITVVDATGVVRAASDPAQIGKPYLPPAGEPLIARRGDLSISSADGNGSFRFVRPITYARQNFGKVDVALSKAELTAVSRVSELLLLLLALVTLGAVAAATYLSGRLLAPLIARLREGLLEIARGNLDMRISHHRHDEFGELFDGVNMVAQSMGERMGSVEALVLDTPLPPGGAGHDQAGRDLPPDPFAAPEPTTSSPSANMPPPAVVAAPPAVTVAPEPVVTGTPGVTDDEADEGGRTMIGAAPSASPATMDGSPPPAPDNRPEPHPGAAPRTATWPRDDDEDRTMTGSLPGNYS